MNDARCALCGEQIKELYTFPDGVVGLAMCICDECKAAVAWARQRKRDEDEMMRKRHELFGGGNTWNLKVIADDCAKTLADGPKAISHGDRGGDGVAWMGEVE